jgi:hypothetical protein
MIKVEFANGYTTIIGLRQTVTERLTQCAGSSVHSQVLSVINYMSSNNSFRDVKTKNYKITLM